MRRGFRWAVLIALGLSVLGLVAWMHRLDPPPVTISAR